MLFSIEHSEFSSPIRLSTDNTERLTDDPVTYGTRSGWREANPILDPYLWVIASAVLPGDSEDAPASASLILENLDSRMVEIVRSFTNLATVHIAVVMADTPDLIEAEWNDLKIVSASVNAGEIALTLSRDEVELEPFPSGRMTRHRFPGLHL